VATTAGEITTGSGRQAHETRQRTGMVFSLWASLVVLLGVIAWIAGVRQYTLRTAVDEGAAAVETRGIGEVGDEVIRKAIRTQHDTLPFWTTLSLLGDFLFEPLSLVIRAVAVTTLFAVIAALTGRPVGFPQALSECAWTQGFWVLGIATRLGLMIALRRPEAETSLALALPLGVSSAAILVASRQVDLFALWGWFSMALGGWRRKQLNLAAAVLVCGVLWVIESAVRITFALTLGAGMRLTVLPV
jgi:hypothetical protein